MRQIVLDTETTGLDPKEGHRIIEVGCVEVINRKVTGNRFHVYINPEREIDDGAVEVHGITNQFLEDKPHYQDVADDLLQYLKGAELIIHNAPFDVGFLNAEYKRLGSWKGIESHCKITDTLKMARKMHPGQKNNLDALCKRYMVDNSSRDLHGALLDAEILAEVFLMMTGGQTSLSLNAGSEHQDDESGGQQYAIRSDRPALRVIKATGQEATEHIQRLSSIAKASDGQCVWDKLEQEVSESEPIEV